MSLEQVVSEAVEELDEPLNPQRHDSCDKNTLVPMKFAPPKLNAGTIARERLLQAVEAFKERKLLLVTARAGFGKTTLMAQLRQKVMSSGDTVVWISLSPEDQNWIYSWTHFVAAFRAAGFPIDDGGLSYEDRDQVRTVLLQIVDAIADNAGDVYLFVDDFHNADSDMQREIQRLLDMSTENFHLVIGSKEITTLPLGKLKSDGQIIEMSEELKFNLDETRLFLHNQLGPEFDEEKIRLIQDECGGWPVSLQLIAHSLKHRTSNDLSTRELIYSAGSLRNYIKRQVFARMPEEVISIWQKLSICPRFSLDLACTLAEPTDNRLVTKVIKDDQLFISAVDSSEASPWFRFLPLFSEMLQERLVRTDPGIVQTLHEKAAEWFTDRGFVLEAIHHARSSPGSAQLEALLDKVPIELRSLRLADAFRDMLSDVDPSTFKSRRAKVIGSWTLFAGGSFRLAETWARQVIAEDPGEDEDFALHQQALKATLAFFYDDSLQFFELYDTLPADRSKASILRHGVTTEAMTFLNALGRYEEVRDFVANRISPGESNDEWALLAQAFGAVSYLNEGEIHEGLGQLKQIMERATAAHGDQSIIVGFCATYIAEALFELGLTSEAHPLLIGRSFALRHLSPDPYTKFCVTMARIMREREGWKVAASYLDEHIESRRGQGGPRPLAWLLAEAATLRLRWQSATVAAPYLAELHTMAEAAEGKGGVCAEIVGLDREVKGRFSLRAAKYDDALQAFDAAYEDACRLRQVRSQIRIELLKAAALYAKGETEAVDALLVRSIETSQQLGLIRTFQDELPEIRTALTARAPHLKISSTTRAHLDMLCAPGGASTTSRARKEKSSEEIFTKRELEIIDLLASSMSNKRIALTLGISPATVKWNLQNIFQKLCVASRYDVIVWARKHLPNSKE